MVTTSEDEVSLDTNLIGEAEEYRGRRGAERGAGEAGAGLSGWLRAARGRGDAGAELVSRAIADAVLCAAFLDDREANNRKASCSNEPNIKKNPHSSVCQDRFLIALPGSVSHRFLLPKPHAIFRSGPLQGSSV